MQNAATTNADTFIEMYSYTQPGEIATKRLRLNRTVQSHPFTIDLDASYSYDNEGKMTSVTYPQSFYSDGSLQPQQSPVTTYTYGFDTMGRPTSMTGPGVDGWGNPATVNIVNNVQFGPANELQQMSYFGSTATLQYNTRLQMTHLTVPGQLNISYNFASSNNGQIASQTDTLSGEQITYQYDALQRLYSASASAWSQTFTYDGFGNLTDKIGTGGAPTNHSPVNAATNQLTGYSYDANGNLITTGYGWDPENRMSYATMGGTQYAYDSANKRVWTGNYTCPGGFCGPGYGWQFQSETVFFYGIEGQRLAAYTPQVKYVNGTPQSIYYLLGEERVYFGSKYIGNANTSLMSGGTSVAQDRLGSAGKYFPYGEERPGQSLPNDAVKFATYTRDSGTGLDYADQRYFDSGLGRFTSADPHRASGGPDNSQSWNSYAYVGNDPINFNDPAGLDQCLVGFWTWTPAGGSPEYGGPKFADCGLSALDAAIYTSWAAYFALQMNDVHPRPTPLSARQIASKSAELAKKWLKDKDCKGLFNLSGNGYDPTQVLSSLTSSGVFISGLNVITLSSFPFGSTKLEGFTLRSINPLLPGADIFFNTTFDDRLDSSDLVVNAAATYIEELGHAYNFTPFSGGSAIVDDGPFPSSPLTKFQTGR